MIEAKRFVGSVMDNVCPMGFWLESMTGTSTVWSNDCISPVDHLISFLNVAVAASALSMFLRSISAEVLEVMAMWWAHSVRFHMSELGCG